MNTVYIDVLFAFNFAVDYILLLITAKISGLVIRRGRILFAAAAGGIYAVLIYFPWLSPLYGRAGKIIATAVICIIAFGFVSLKQTVRNSLTFFMCSLALSGMTLFFYYSAGGKVNLRNGIPYIDISMKTFILAFAGCYILLSLIFRGRAKSKNNKRIIKLTVCEGDKKLSLRALLDTGCSLSEPICGSPVIVCDILSVCGLFDGEAVKILSAFGKSSPADCLDRLSRVYDVRKFKIVPYRTASSGNNIMLAFKPDSIKKPDGKKVNALIGISGADIPPENGYTALTGTI